MARSVRRCEFCSSRLPKDARPNRKFCDEDCRRGRSKAAPAVADQAEVGQVLDALEQSIAEAKRTNRLDVLDASAMAAARVIARRIDEDEARWTYCMAWVADENAEGRRPHPPKGDNTILPTYLKYLDSLGLTPSGRKPVTAEGDGGTGGGSTGGIGALAQGVPRPDPK